MSNIMDCPYGHRFSKTRYGTICPHCGFDLDTPEKVYVNLRKECGLSLKEERPVCAWLVCIEGVRRGKSYVISFGENFIGTDRDNEIQILGDEKMKKKHTLIYFDEKENKGMLLPARADGIVYIKEDMIMGFFDQLGDVAKNLGAAAGDLAKQVSDKTNDALEISKLNSKISAERVEIEKEKKKISETLIEKFAKGEEVPEEIKGFCEAIKEHFLNIDKLNEEIEKVKNTVGKKAEEVKDAVAEKAEEVKDAVAEKAEDVAEKAEEVKDQAVDTFNEAKEAVEDKVEDVKEDIKEGVDNIQN